MAHTIKCYWWHTAPQSPAGWVSYSGLCTHPLHSAVPKAKALCASPLTANQRWGGGGGGYLLSEKSAWTKSMLDTDISREFIEITCPCKLQKTLFQM